MKGRGISAAKSTKAAKTMKPSGVAWIGDIPEGWEVRKLKSALIANDGGVWGEDPTGDGSDVIVLRSTEQSIEGHLMIDAPAIRHIDKIDEEKFLLQEGDLIITKSSGSQEHIGKTSIIDRTTADMKCCYSNFLQRLRVYGVPQYFWYVMNSQMVKRQFDYLVTTTTGLKNLNASIIGNVQLAIPPLAEQKAIAAYLDEKCAAIDAAVAEAKKGIEEYKAWKKSLIFEMVTGKNRVDDLAAKNAKVAKTKPSGIPWIGDIPEGWRVARLKNCAKVFGRIGFRGYTTADIVDEGDGALSLSPSNLKDIRMDYTKRTYISWAKYKESPEIQVRKGDIVFVKTGSSYGKSCIVDELFCEATLNPQLVVLKDFSCNSRFLNYFLQTPVIKYQVELIVSGGTIPTMSQEKMGLWKVVLPPIPEQQAIADYLDEKCAAIDALVAEKEALIADFEAYKKSLIYETVTGKREVA